MPKATDATSHEEPIGQMAAWDAKAWLASLMSVGADELAVRSIDRYGATETQVRYEQAGAAVARVTVTGPVREMLVKPGDGYWVVKAQIGSGTNDVHELRLPESEEIVY
jgi:hypothetical protein